MRAPELALLVEGFDPARGGAERAVRSLAEAWASEGRAVAVYTPASRSGPPLPAPARQVEVSLPDLPRPLWARVLARRLAEVARGEGAEHLIACGKLLGADLYWPHGGAQAAAREASLAGRSRWARLGRRLRASEWSYASIERRAAAACRPRRGAAPACQAVALSGRVRQDFQRHLGLDPGQVAVVPNGVADHFRPPSAEERGEARRALARRASVRGDAALILFCAHSFRLKGLETLLRAAAGVAGAHVVVAGAGDPRPFLPLAQGLGLHGRLSFLGRVRDLRPVYWGATLLAHPSGYDPCSLVVLEALACGLPVIGSPADGASERIGAAGCVLESPDDVEGLEEALERCAEPSQRRPLAEAAAEFRRPWSAVGAELLALLEPAETPA
jgi:UDP-glucose:(heptosyl)LPS alpha-1,3-glucosyltransferase